MIIDPEGHEVSAVLPRLPAVGGCRVVEIGCGDGRLTRRYSARVGSIVAIDPDETLVAACRASGIDPNVDLRAISVDCLELPDASVDAVLFSWAL